MTKREEFRKRIDVLKLVLNALIEEEAEYKKIYFVSLMIDKLSNKLYFPAEKNA